MRRFSQRNQLVTLNEINITPLLDLAFVLLIIFIITTPLLEPGIPLKLPEGGIVRSALESSDIVVAEVTPEGVYWFRGRRMENVATLEKELVIEFQRNPKMVVKIRAAAEGKFLYPVAIIELCRRHGINRFDLATEPPRR